MKIIVTITFKLNNFIVHSIHIYTIHIPQAIVFSALYSKVLLFSATFMFSRLSRTPHVLLSIYTLNNNIIEINK